MQSNENQLTRWLRRWTGPFRLTDPLRSRDLRIGILGSSRSGKSVLLTSILDHLKNYDPELLRFTKPVRVRRFREVEPPEGLPVFPFQRFRGQLSQEGRWPLKTKAAYRFDCEVEFEDQLKFWPKSLRIQWLDFPGERLADIAMGGRTYAEWSDVTWESILSGAGDVPGLQAMQQAMDDSEAMVESLSAAYKRLLAGFSRSYRPLVSPSAFLLCSQGTQPGKGASDEQMVSERPIGIDLETPVVPLPEAVRERLPQVSKVFEGNYKRYVKELAEPLFHQLSRCDRILCAVNIPEILASGPETLNDTADLITRFLDASLPPAGITNKLTQYVRNRLLAPVLDESWRPGGIDRVAFVATQADRVLAQDCDRLRRLLDQMLKSPVRNTAPQLKYRTFTASAVCAAQTVDNQLVGQLTPPAEGAEVLSRFSIPSLPNEWPDRWSGDDFSFPEVYPRFSPIRSRPPKQEGLAEILEYLFFS
ncbi:MAG: YcjX family protein [Opitutales bacterium]|nr:YcjX family protein [Opitutales bacterium]